MNFTSTLLTMAELFLILAVGAGAHRAKLFPESTQAVLTKLVVYITTPCSILNSVLSNDDLPELGTLVQLLLISTACYLGIAVFAFLVVRLLRIPLGSRGTYMCMLLCSNCGFIGFPVVQAIFGSEAVLYAAVLNIPYYPALNILGVWLLLRDRACRNGTQQRLQFRWTTLLDPCIIASLVSVVLAVTGWKFPALFTGTISSIAAMTTPAALLAIGIAVGKMSLRSMLGKPKLYLMCLIRLVVLPLLVWGVLHLFVTDPLVLGTAVVIFAMPTAVLVGMMASEHGGDEDAAVQGVFLSTVLSVITIPMLIAVLL